MSWKRCEICNQDFDTIAEVCPNHTGHVLKPILHLPQPVEPEESFEVSAPVEAPVIEEPVAVEEAAPEGSPVVEEVKEEVKEETPGWISGE